MEQESPNIVLVSIDSLRGDHCGYLDSEYELTPTLDRLATEGVGFTNAISTGPQTFSSMPAVFTGQNRPCETLTEYPGETHWKRRMQALNRHIESNVLLPERLQQEGYTTVGINPNPWMSTAAGFDRGFDTYIDLSTSGSDSRLAQLMSSLPIVSTESRSAELAINMVTNRSFFSKWPEILAEITRVRDDISQPYFLWVFLLDPHFPFLSSRAERTEQSLPGMYYANYRSEECMRGRNDEEPPPAWVLQALQRSYRDTIRASDRFLEELLETLKRDNPALLVHSDHGESFGEHGNYGHHHRQLFEENIHVPFVAHNVGQTMTVNAPISLARIEGIVRRIASHGTFTPEAFVDDYVVATSECGRNKAVRGQQFKYFQNRDEEYLFDLETDPTEQYDVAGEHQSRLETMQAVLDRHEQSQAELTKLTAATKELVADCST